MLKLYFKFYRKLSCKYINLLIMKQKSNKQTKSKNKKKMMKENMRHKKCSCALIKTKKPTYVYTQSP